MGTYTANYNLFMPTVGETGWGTLVNGNFTTIDTTMKSLSNRITAVENEVNGALSCTSVTTSGKVTANGGISTKTLTATTGTFSGVVTGSSGTFSGSVSSSNISDRNVWVLILSETSSNLSNYPVHFNVLGSVNASTYGSVTLDFINITLSPGSSTSRLVCYNPHNTTYGITPIVDIKVIGGSWSYTAHTNGYVTATFNSKTITNSGISMSLAEVKSMLTTPFNSTIKNTGTSATSQYSIRVLFNNTSSNQQYGYLVPLDLIS